MFYLCSMQPVAASTYSDTDLEMIAAMTKDAFELAQTTHRMAMATIDDAKTFLALVTAYRHLSFTVRMSIRLRHALPKLAAAAAKPVAEKAEQPEPLDVERPERPDRPERLEYERDYEPVSLERFLARLRGAVTRIDRMGDIFPAGVRETTLPNLKRLLAQAGTPVAEPRPPTRPQRPPRPAPVDALTALMDPPPQAHPTRAGLLGSTGTIRPPARPAPS